MRKFKQYIMEFVFSGSIMTIDDIIDYHSNEYTPHELDYFRQALENNDSLIIDDYQYVLYESKLKKFIKRITNKIKL